MDRPTQNPTSGDAADVNIPITPAQSARLSELLNIVTQGAQAIGEEFGHVTPDMWVTIFGKIFPEHGEQTDENVSHEHSAQQADDNNASAATDAASAIPSLAELTAQIVQDHFPKQQLKKAKVNLNIAPANATTAQVTKAQRSPEWALIIKYGDPRASMSADELASTLVVWRRWYGWAPALNVFAQAKVASRAVCELMNDQPWLCPWETEVWQKSKREFATKKVADLRAAGDNNKASILESFLGVVSEGGASQPFANILEPATVQRLANTTVGETTQEPVFSNTQNTPVIDLTTPDDQNPAVGQDSHEHFTEHTHHASTTERETTIELKNAIAELTSEIAAEKLNHHIHTSPIGQITAADHEPAIEQRNQQIPVEHTSIHDQIGQGPEGASEREMVGSLGPETPTKIRDDTDNNAPHSRGRERVQQQTRRERQRSRSPQRDEQRAHSRFRDRSPLSARAHRVPSPPPAAADDAEKELSDYEDIENREHTPVIPRPNLRLSEALPALFAPRSPGAEHSSRAPRMRRPAMDPFSFDDSPRDDNEDDDTDKSSEHTGTAAAAVDVDVDVGPHSHSHSQSNSFSNYRDNVIDLGDDDDEEEDDEDVDPYSQAHSQAYYHNNGIDLGDIIDLDDVDEEDVELYSHPNAYTRFRDNVISLDDDDDQAADPYTRSHTNTYSHYHSNVIDLGDSSSSSDNNNDEDTPSSYPRAWLAAARGPNPAVAADIPIPSVETDQMALFPLPRAPTPRAQYGFLGRTSPFPLYPLCAGMSTSDMLGSGQGGLKRRAYEDIVPEAVEERGGSFKRRVMGWGGDDWEL
ncbi:uncharacterized protein K452DRAFT_346559 [Aplosporella prunicola CBS 121167]|uniref:Uncharacterized protein n=1 Tax=Aplosporella prunicola CBS 121167 TaxID=1176127 RepID=A0A6A6BIR3_9PEZI|nr:uncharacterized protein K452DRAFT_346559 [Aplosporella prunicola CBS 121167]KAF2143896.1 hypothetical protein K452DRAFT_346559 [Aplosporella prunicola CBS 121167]